MNIVNKYGGNMLGAIGVPEEQLRKAASMAVCKINIDSDIRLAMTATIRQYMAEHPDHFDPRQYLKPARQAVKDMVARSWVHVLGITKDSTHLIIHPAPQRRRPRRGFFAPPLLSTREGRDRERTPHERCKRVYALRW